MTKKDKRLSGRQSNTWLNDLPSDNSNNNSCLKHEKKKIGRITKL